MEYVRDSIVIVIIMAAGVAGAWLGVSTVLNSDVGSSLKASRAQEICHETFLVTYKLLSPIMETDAGAFDTALLKEQDCIKELLSGERKKTIPFIVPVEE